MTDEVLTERLDGGRQDELFQPGLASADAQERPRAFAEKRAPMWQGE